MILKTVLIITFAALALFCLAILFYAFVLTISDLRDASKRLKQIQKDRDELWAQYTRSYKEHKR